MMPWSCTTSRSTALFPVFMFYQADALIHVGFGLLRIMIYYNINFSKVMKCLVKQLHFAEKNIFLLSQETKWRCPHLKSFLFRYFSLQATNPLGFGDSVRMEIESNICREGGPLPDCFTTPLQQAWTTMEKVRLGLWRLYVITWTVGSHVHTIRPLTKVSLV